MGPEHGHNVRQRYECISTLQDPDAQLRAYIRALVSGKRVDRRVNLRSVNAPETIVLDDDDDDNMNASTQRSKPGGSKSGKGMNAWVPSVRSRRSAGSCVSGKEAGGRASLSSWDAPPYLIISDDDELDLNVPIQRLTSAPSLDDPESDDPINCLARVPASRNPPKAMDHDPPKNQASRSSNPHQPPGNHAVSSAFASNGSSSTRTAQDGDATTRLYARLEDTTKDGPDTRSDGTDTIDNFSDDSPRTVSQRLADKPFSGNVRKKIDMFEQNRQIAPSSDGLKQSRLSKKDAMKKRSGNGSTLVSTLT